MHPSERSASATSARAYTHRAGPQNPSSVQSAFSSAVHSTLATQPNGPVSQKLALSTTCYTPFHGDLIVAGRVVVEQEQS
jgi:hypothetical protein